MNQSRGTITLLRHGATEWSPVGRYAGLIDIPLTDNGRRQVQQARTKLDGPYDDVLASPLLRARQSADILGFRESRIDDRLRERDYGDYEGLTTAEIRERVPGFDVWSDTWPSGESIASFTERIDDVIADLGPSPGHDVLVIAHAHVIRLFTARWLGLDPAHARLFRIDTMGMTVLGWERETPTLHRWNV